MRPASVGFHCPDDVAAGARTVRQARTVHGGRVSADSNAAALTILGLCLVAFGVQTVVGGSVAERFGDLLGPVLLSDGSVGGVAEGELYRVVTSMFLHVGALHLLMNMGALVALAPPLEAALGRLRFVVLYLLSGVGGSVAALLLDSPRSLSIGASGALFGLMTAGLVSAKATGSDTTFLRQYLLIGTVFSVAAPLLGFPLSWQGHLGGALTGAAVGAAFVLPGRGRGRTTQQALGVLGVVAVLAGLLAYVLVARP